MVKIPQKPYNMLARSRPMTVPVAAQCKMLDATHLSQSVATYPVHQKLLKNSIQQEHNIRAEKWNNEKAVSPSQPQTANENVLVGLISVVYAE